MYRSENKIVNKIVHNFRKGLISESDMLNQLYDADKNTYCTYINSMYTEECEDISSECEAEGYPSNGSNYDLRCENLGNSYYQCYGYNPSTGECTWDDTDATRMI